ncbi:MAG TPA: tripartite tricarboxylate transporter substrate binding protein [Burkholderiales bacterium]|nr:tripartite tricarboxylate transporter substrate binding protein [Burkholderiales bacterium]
MVLPRHLLLCVALSGAVAVAQAQTYPAKPIRVVVGFAAGGPTDLAARLIGQKLTEKWGQQVVVDVRAGAGGNIAAEIVAKAPPDGYTLLLPAFAHAVNPTLFRKLPFDTLKDFAPIALFASAANILAVHPSVPATSVKELIALAKARPGQLTFGSAGNGTASHLAGELLNMMAGVRLTHVPYKGSAPASTDLLGGQISMAFPGVAIALPHTRSGRLRSLAITSLRRSRIMPELPTMSEAGLEGFEVISWYGLLAPTGTPAEVVQRLNADVTRGLHDADAMERLSSFGAEPVDTTPAQFGAFIQKEVAKWAKVIHAANMHVD